MIKLFSLIASFFFTIPIISSLYKERELFLNPIINSTVTPVNYQVTGIIVPHHLLAIDMIANIYKIISKNKYSTIIILSPDHFDTGLTNISTTENNFQTPFGTIESDQKIINKIKTLPFVKEQNAFYREHGLQAQLPFIKYFFPKTKILTLTFKTITTKNEVDQLFNVLQKYLPKDTLIIQSTDLSHYLPPNGADIKDKQTLLSINSNTAESALDLTEPQNIDSKACLYLQKLLQKKLFNSDVKIISHKNSQSYSQKEIESSTSYLTAIYSSNGFFP